MIGPKKTARFLKISFSRGVEKSSQKNPGYDFDELVFIFG
jgi:hypothetical protein